MTHNRKMKEFLQHHIHATSKDLTMVLQASAPNNLKFTVHEIFDDGLLVEHPTDGRMVIPFASIVLIRV